MWRNQLIYSYQYLWVDKKWKKKPKKPGYHLSIKTPSYQYRKSQYGDKTILWPSYLHNGISYTGKMMFFSLYWIMARVTQLLLDSSWQRYEVELMVDTETSFGLYNEVTYVSQSEIFDMITILDCFLIRGWGHQTPSINISAMITEPASSCTWVKIRFVQVEKEISILNNWNCLEYEFPILIS